MGDGVFTPIHLWNRHRAYACTFCSVVHSKQTMFSLIQQFLLYSYSDISLIEKQLILSPSCISLSFSEDIYLLRVIIAAGQSVSQAGKNPQGK